MFKKLYLLGASPPRWPGAGPGHLPSNPLTPQQFTQTVLKENENGH
jgi:hypothetical protein